MWPLIWLLLLPSHCFPGIKPPSSSIFSGLFSASKFFLVFPFFSFGVCTGASPVLSGSAAFPLSANFCRHITLKLSLLRAKPTKVLQTESTLLHLRDLEWWICWMESSNACLLLTVQQLWMWKLSPVRIWIMGSYSFSSPFFLAA